MNPIEAVIRLPLPPLADMGEAMRSLTPHQRAFVVALVWYGAKNWTEAESMVSPSQSRKGLNTIARRHAHHPRVQAALKEEGDRFLRQQGAASIFKLVELRDGAKDQALQLKAAVELLNRGGFHAVIETHQHRHEHLSDEESVRLLAGLLRQLGVSSGEIDRVTGGKRLTVGADGVYEEQPATVDDASAPDAD